MGDYSEFGLKIRATLAVYRWQRIDPMPWAELGRPVAEANVALVSTAGLALPGQALFDDGVKGGDFSFREVPSSTDPQCLVESHRSDAFSRDGLAEDRNLVFPIDRMHELEREGAIGRFNARCISFMGSITAPRRLMLETAPRAAEILVGDGVDVALLVPV
ncbi:MAG: selenoprotein B glycine/betaine/sarcosine/D-proline reductase [Acidobacteria bacterium]|nr:selenoprotein B glycine/betaine/sarcosine/D-proline reductase [Acidobacteriota bacterium]